MFLLSVLVLPVPLISAFPLLVDLLAPDVGLFPLILDVLLLIQIFIL